MTLLLWLRTVHDSLLFLFLNLLFICKRYCPRIKRKAKVYPSVKTGCLTPVFWFNGGRNLARGKGMLWRVTSESQPLLYPQVKVKVKPLASLYASKVMQQGDVYTETKYYLTHWLKHKSSYGVLSVNISRLYMEICIHI